jgi:hypothetical protein
MRNWYLIPVIAGRPKFHTHRVHEVRVREDLFHVDHQGWFITCGGC